MSGQQTRERQRWMAVLARASTTEIDGLLAGCDPLPRYTRLRGPELGLVMARGRTGGGGTPFNLGELTVSRCAVRTEEGRIGHAYVAGRDLKLVELAALLDGCLQDETRRDLRTRVIVPLAQLQDRRRALIAAKAASTRVQFFTMATMRG